MYETCVLCIGRMYKCARMLYIKRLYHHTFICLEHINMIHVYNVSTKSVYPDGRKREFMIRSFFWLLLTVVDQYVDTEKNICWHT